tara:strand:+ start:67 stop:1311 length:1245 start_codon:yes stop_codon:yes gene_type:complete
MAHNYSKGATVQGDIKAADDAERNTLIDFGEDQIDFQTSGSVRLRIQNTEITANTPLTVSGEISAAGMVQSLNTITGATGEVDHNCSNSHIFYHSNIAGNFTPNLTQLDLSNNEITNISIILDQGGTAYLPDTYKVNSTASSLYWEGSAMPTGSANKVDTVDLKVLRVSDSYSTFARFHNTIEIAAGGGGGVTIPNNALMFLDASDANSYGGSGTTWTDLSGQNKHGTLVNTPSWNNSDKLFEFSGNSSQHITVPSGFADFSNGVTFFIVADLGVGNNWERFLDFSVGGQTNHAFNFGRKQTNTNLSLQYYTVTEGGNKTLESNQISNNTLASYAVTTDGSNAKIYKNGSLAQTISFGATLSNTTRTQNYIGRSRGGGDAYYEGDIGVVGIFNRDLSASEITALHNAYATIYSL